MAALWRTKGYGNARNVQTYTSGIRRVYMATQTSGAIKVKTVCPYFNPSDVPQSTELRDESTRSFNTVMSSTRVRLPSHLYHHLHPHLQENLPSLANNKKTKQSKYIEKVCSDLYYLKIVYVNNYKCVDIS